MLIFIAGLGLGYLLHSVSFQTKPYIAVIFHDDPAESRKVMPVPNEPKLKPVPNRPLEVVAEKVPAAPMARNVPFRLEEETVHAMENARESLRDLAYSERLSEGWKIHLLTEDNVFQRSGIQDGDLITFDSINSQYRDPARARLMGRFVAILDTIQR